jgi:hypothetical protein
LRVDPWRWKNRSPPWKLWINHQPKNQRHVKVKGSFKKTIKRDSVVVRVVEKGWKRNCWAKEGKCGSGGLWFQLAPIDNQYKAKGALKAVKRTWAAKGNIKQQEN